MAKKIIFTLVGLLLVAGGLAGVKFLQIKTMIAAGSAYVPPPETVTTSDVRRETWQPSLNAIGSVIAVQGVTLRAEGAGVVRRIAFESGATVREGQVLVELDTEVEQAQLRSATANAELVRTNLNRTRDLRNRNMISQAELDTAEAQVKQAEAQLDNFRAVIAKKTLKAPFTGRTGLRQINLGQFLNTGDLVVSLQSLDPVYVDFALPQQRLAQLKTGLTVQVATDAAPGQTFTGELSAIHPEVEPTTRNIRLRATLANPQGLLRPGMFVTASAQLPNTETVLVIPATAVLYAPYGDSVFVVEEKKDEKTGTTSKVLNQRFVRLGRTQGDFVVVTSGLEAGQTLVTTGVFKLRNGMHVVVDNKLSPDFQLAPKPANS